MQHARRMHDSTDRGPTLSAKLLEESAHLFFIRDVRGYQMHAGTGFFELANDGCLSPQMTAALQRAPARAWRKLRASQQDQATSPLRHHPARDLQSEVS